MNSKVRDTACLTLHCAKCQEYKNMDTVPGAHRPVEESPGWQTLRCSTKEAFKMKNDTPEQGAHKSAWGPQESFPEELRLQLFLAAFERVKRHPR